MKSCIPEDQLRPTKPTIPFFRFAPGSLRPPGQFFSKIQFTPTSHTHRLNLFSLPAANGLSAPFSSGRTHWPRFPDGADPDILPGIRPKKAKHACFRCPLARTALDYIATAYAAIGGLAFFGLPVVWLGHPMLSMDPLKAAHVLAASVAGPGLSTWMFFPLLGTRFGFPGALKDTLLLILATALASVITAFLIFPALVMLFVAPVLGLVMVMKPSMQTLIFLSVFLTVLTLGRLKPRQ